MISVIYFDLSELRVTVYYLQAYFLSFCLCAHAQFLVLKVTSTFICPAHFEHIVIT